MDSILMQDYPFIEMFLIDDGSTDNTKEVIYNYIPRFEQKGYKLNYIYSENKGQSTALDIGLKLINGEFLVWPDCDDFYSCPNSISHYVKTFNELDESYGLVRCIGTFVEEQTLKPIYYNTNWATGESLFEQCLYGYNFLIVPINYMMRMEAFDKVCVNRGIYTGRRPQNIQMFDPILYSYKCYTIPESLCKIVVRNTSDSHCLKTFEQILDDMQGFLDIHRHTLQNIATMPDTEKQKYINNISQQLLNKQMTFCVKNHRLDLALEKYNKMKSMKLKLSLKNKILYLLISASPKFVYCLTNNYSKR